VTRRDVSTVSLPIGPASRAVELRQGNSRNITYVLMLGGRTIILTGTSREEDTGMIELMYTVAASLAQPERAGARQPPDRPAGLAHCLSISSWSTPRTESSACLPGILAPAARMTEVARARR
jgi:hypothetical protein